MLLLAKELGKYILLEVNSSGETEAGSISNHWRQTCVLLSRKQGSMTPQRNLPMCFIGLICCLTSVSLLLMLPFLPSASTYPSTSPSLSPPPLNFPPSIASISLLSHMHLHKKISCISSCVSVRAEEAHYERFQCWDLWGLFYLTPVLPRKAL